MLRQLNVTSVVKKLHPTLNNMKSLTRTASFTDIHWGAKTNSELHNQDCDRYIDWFCEQVRKDPQIDSIVFMGDWFEIRAAVNVMTAQYSYHGAKKINELGLPVFFIIGNHDLYHRHTRAVYSPINFHEFTNFRIINEPTVIPELGVEGSLVSPFLFHEEYASLVQYKDIPVWWGHFEFKGFVITGHSITMPTGPDPLDYDGPKRIFTGHFHKRQISRNICYIGNTFPTNFSDAGDIERGMMVYDHKKNKVEFLDWDDCPKYTKTKLTTILDGGIVIHPQSRVKCIVDVPLTFQESTALRQKMMEEYELREFSMEESREKDDVLEGTEASVENDGSISEDDLGTLDELVIQMLSDISSDLIDNNMLIEQYKRLTL